MKAFNSVPHKRVNYKISRYGIGGGVGRWIQAFLMDRQQQVVVNGQKSSWSDVLSGIPQGTVLGPILFILYINDLPDVIKNGSQVYLFADDTKIYRQVKDETDHQKLQEDLDSLVGWSKKWMLKFHPQKCKVLEVGIKAKENHVYNIDGTNLSHVSSEKDIGVTIDHNLTFLDHISDKINKSNKIVGTIRRTFKHLTHIMFSKLFKALVRPHLEYANPVWSPYLKKDIIAVENVQRRATKLLPGLKEKSYPERLRALKLPSLAYRRLRGDMVEAFKILNGHYDSSVSQGILCQADGSTRTNRGHTKKLFKRRARLRLRQKFFSMRIVDIWNDLPQKVIDSPSIKCFEARLDRVWKEQDIIYNFKGTWQKIRHITEPEAGSEDEDDLDLSI